MTLAMKRAELAEARRCLRIAQQHEQHAADEASDAHSAVTNAKKRVREAERDLQKAEQ